MEIQIGKKGTNIFVRMVGLSSVYIPSFSTNYHSTFDGKANTLYAETPWQNRWKIKFRLIKIVLFLIKALFYVFYVSLQVKYISKFKIHKSKNKEIIHNKLFYIQKI